MTQTISREPSDPLFQPAGDSDPATPGDPLTRLRFHYGQCLSADDFEVEQRYFVLRQRLHNALLHGVGTVWGLAIRRQEPTPAGGDQLICEPGMAIDPLGREIWVSQPLCLDLAALELSFWNELQPVDLSTSDVTASSSPGARAAKPPARRAYVVLRYDTCLTREVPVIPLPCGDDREGLAASRLRDSFRLCLEAQAPPDPYATVRDISLRLGWGERPAKPRRGDRWRAADGTVWIYGQPRNADGKYRSDDPATPMRESKLIWQLDPAASATSAEWRQLLLDHALQVPIGEGRQVPGPLERFWSGADDAALLLATVDLVASGPPTATALQPVRLGQRSALRSNPDNSVRAVLPAVQALADLTLNVRLEGAAPRAPTVFQALEVSARALDSSGTPIVSGSAEAILIEVSLSLPVAIGREDPMVLGRSIQLLFRSSAGLRWEIAKPTKIQTTSAAEGPRIQLWLKPAWSVSTAFQVMLRGIGPTALLSDTSVPQPLRGVAGEVVPPGSGRDAVLFGTYNPPTP